MDSSNQNTSTKDICRSCLIERVLPAIQSKWPCCNATDPIYIQQDNARPHVNPSDPAFVEAATKDGFDLCLSYQPPQSLDMNVLDLGYFRAIQSLQHQEAPKSINELVYAVEKSFEELSSDSLNRVFLSWQTCMIEGMKVNGRNNYKLPRKKPTVERWFCYLGVRAKFWKMQWFIYKNELVS